MTNRLNVKKQAVKPTIHFIEDNQELYRQWSLFFSDYEYDVINYKTADSFIREYKQYPVECIVIDIWLPGLNGDQLYGLNIKDDISAPCIFWSGQLDVKTAVKLMKQGAFDVLEKGCGASEFKNSIDDAMMACEKIRNKITKVTIFQQKIRCLSPKELDVFHLMLDRKTVEETAQIRHVSPRTITEQRKSIFRKLDIKSSHDVYAYCKEIGYVES